MSLFIELPRNPEHQYKAVAAGADNALLNMPQNVVNGLTDSESPTDALKNIGSSELEDFAAGGLLGGALSALSKPIGVLGKAADDTAIDNLLNDATKVDRTAIPVYNEGIGNEFPDTREFSSSSESLLPETKISTIPDTLGGETDADTAIDRLFNDATKADNSIASNNGKFKSAFAKNIDSTLAKNEISLDKFNLLRLKDVTALNDIEKSILKTVRESMAMPDQNTLMQKVIPAGDIQKYLNGTYTQVGGYVAKAEDVSHLKTYEDIHKSLRLDYPNSAYSPKTGLGIIRFKTPDSSQMEIPYSPEMGGTTKAAQPFTGNGFIKSTNGQIIPEFKANNYMTLSDGSELYEITNEGKWKLRAIYDADLKRFLQVI